ncbi:NAD(P)-dependent oxidoreductase [Pseudactinotalea sp. Z1732]|uniref:NAD(P)-dependent oxidoreductase n=1 Tax=Micrococcales TaxID=85006 RepID=UPI003C7EB9DD
MRMTVFGASGLAGSALVELAVREGHTVRSFVRPSTAAPPALARCEVVRGDALDPDAVACAIAGADVVVSTLGGFRGPASMAVGTANIVAAMQRDGPARLVVLQGFHIDFPGDPNNAGRSVMRALLALRCRPLLGHSAALGDLLRGTDDLAWTLVRVPRIVKGPASGRGQTGRFALGPTSSVRLGDVAATLLELTDNSAHVHAAPMLITTRRFRPQSPTRSARGPHADATGEVPTA